MYAYDRHDRMFVHARVEQFRGQAARRLSGELSEDEFKPLRLQNGLYLQLHAYMLRVAIPYGTLSAAQMRQLAVIARRHDRGFGHFTTRQNIQFNWIKLEEAADALQLLADVDMHAIQTSGNCIRNVTADAWAGVAPDEIEDPRIWSEIIRQWSTAHPEFSFLPRKFKIAVTGSPADRAAVRVHDIGLRMHRNAAGEAGFEVIVGGGLGRTPFIGVTLKEWLPKRDLLSYLEAVLRTYNRYGRRDNLYKSRIKILVHEMGAEKVRADVEAEWLAIRDGVLALDEATVAGIARHFAPPDYPRQPLFAEAHEALRRSEPAYRRWVGANVAPHRAAGYAIVHLSLKPEGGVPGDATAEQMEAVADLAEVHSLGEIRVTHTQNLVLPHVPVAALPAIWRAAEKAGFATPNINLVTDIIACPGLDYCSLANARSIPVAQRITRRFADREKVAEIGPLPIKISGCINACGHHHIGAIGILGVDKQGEEFYQITLGGDAGPDARLGDLLGPAIAYDKVADVVEQVVDAYLELRRPGEDFLKAYARLGLAPFKERVYAAR